MGLSCTWVGDFSIHLALAHLSQRDLAHWPLSPTLFIRSSRLRTLLASCHEAYVHRHPYAIFGLYVG